MNSKISEIDRVHPQIREKLSEHLQEYPVKVGAIAKDFGIVVKVSSLGTGISGKIEKENDVYVIRVNRNETRERQRFTIAHEIAHFFLHRDLIDGSPDGITDNVLYRSGNSEQVEFEANRLAAEILMPSDLVREKLDDINKRDIDEFLLAELAKQFEVSKAAMEIRLSILE